MSRIAPLVDGLLGTEDADELLVDIMGALGDSVGSIPEVGKIYVFAYQPSTPNIRYDQNPFDHIEYQVLMVDMQTHISYQPLELILHYHQVLP